MDVDDTVKGDDATDVDFLPSYPTVDSYSQATLRKILLCTKHSNQIPGDNKVDWDGYCIFPGFRNVMSTQNATIRSMIKSQLNYNNVKVKLTSNDVEELMDILSDANDSILERVHMSLDEAAGLKRTVDPLLLEVSQAHVNKVSGSWNNFRRGQAHSSEDSSQVKLLAAKNVLRPQMKFTQFIDNSKNPFVPRLSEKPHSIKPLSILVEYDEGSEEIYSHPYIYEIERFTPTAEQLSAATPTVPPSIEDAELVMVTTHGQLKLAVSELAHEKVIGVDLEHHSYRSYLGFTCLIQISTHTKDFLIDPFQMWEELTLLNEIMANPKIVKAGKLLGLPRLSLAWLLQNYCKLDGDKQFQLADWRIRPLPEAMIRYARQDTRHLGYLYTRLKNDLLEKGNSSTHLLQSAIHQSNDIAKKRFQKPVVRPNSHLHLVTKARANLNNKQMWAAKELYLWRDKVGRTEDESTNYVLPNHMLLKIATELPREMQGILACCNPVPPLVKQNLGLLHTIILNARDKQLVTVEVTEDAIVGKPNNDGVLIEVLENPLESPLDLGHFADLGQLDTLLTKKANFPKSRLQKQKPDLTVFSKDKTRKETNALNFVSPYQRLSLLKPYLESLNKKEDSENKDKQNSMRTERENLRLDSIKKVFDQLTSMTAKQAEKKVVEEVDDDDDDDGEIEDDSDDAVEPKRPYFTDDQPYRKSTEKVVGIRVGAQVKRGKGKNAKGTKRSKQNDNDGDEEITAETDAKPDSSSGGCYTGGEQGHFAKQCPTTKKNHNANKKRKSDANDGEEVVAAKTAKTDFDYDNVDFSKFGKKSGSSNQDAKKHNKNQSGGGRQKQRYKNSGNRSSTFKR